MFGRLAHLKREASRQRSVLSRWFARLQTAICTNGLRLVRSSTMLEDKLFTNGACSDERKVMCSGGAAGGL